MKIETNGIVLSASKQWWLKVNTKPVRLHTLDGAVFPYIIKVQYTVNGVEYIKRKWIKAGEPVPQPGSFVKLVYSESNPGKAEIIQ